MRPADWLRIENPLSWSDFVTKVVGTTTTGWAFRGQHDDSFPLDTSLERTLKQTPRAAWGDREDSAIDFFRTRATAALAAVPSPDDYLGWLALMQHYRAPTRLLDWSESPFVAAYFAYVDMDTEAPPDFVTVWALNVRSLREAFREDGVVKSAGDYLWNDDPIDISYPNRGVNPAWPPLARESATLALENAYLRFCRHEEVKVPFPTRPPTFDRRMLAQRAIFTFDGALQGGIPFPLTDLFGSEGGDVVKRIDLDSRWRDEALLNLSQMGVSTDVLFPGLEGIGDATAFQVRPANPPRRPSRARVETRSEDLDNFRGDG